MIDRSLQIATSAEKTCGGFRSEVSEVGILAYKLGARWADENPCFGKRIILDRNDAGNLTADIRNMLCSLSSDKACLARRKDDHLLYLLDPDSHMVNDYAVLEDPDFIEVIVINII